MICAEDQAARRCGGSAATRDRDAAAGGRTACSCTACRGAAAGAAGAREADQLCKESERADRRAQRRELTRDTA
jgi:hypothetical protein